MCSCPLMGREQMTPVSTHLERSPARNKLLAAMSASDFALLRPHLKSIELPVFKDLEQPNRRIDMVYFMESGIASVVAIQPDDTKVEVGLIGREGMSGIAVVLGGNQSPNSTYIQVAGDGRRILASELRKAMDASESLRGLLFKFVQVYITQTTQTAIANARAHINQRLARWILMAHDRTGNDTIPLTHEFLALMQGVRRVITYVGRAPHEAFFTPDDNEVWVTVRGEDYIAVMYGYVCSSFNPAGSVPSAKGRAKPGRCRNCDG